MSNLQERKSDVLYFVDSRIREPKPFVRSAFLYEVKECGRFTLSVYPEVHRDFASSDYGVIVFETCAEAQALVDKQPRTRQKVYVLDRDRKTVTEEVVDYFDIPYVYFRNGARALVVDAEKVFFKTEEQAMKALNN